LFTMAYGLRETGITSLFPLSPLCSIPSFAMTIGSKTKLTLLVSEAKVYIVFSEPCESTRSTIRVPSLPRM
jgi:hypothetical protein